MRIAACPVEPQTFESEFAGWKLFGWMTHGTWHVTAELFDRVALRHGICWGYADSREEAEEIAKKRITENNKVKWTQYEKKEAGRIGRVKA